MKTIITLILALSLSLFAQVKVTIPGAEKVEAKDNLNLTLKLPFDEEYKINLDNTDQDRRALVKIRIDGRNVTDDGLILRRGETIALERFLDTGDLASGPKFKFVEKTDQLRKTRKDNTEDGQIIVIVQYEKSDKPVVEYQFEQAHYWGYGGFTPCHDLVISADSNLLDTQVSYSNVSFTSGRLEIKGTPDVAEGVTVEGERSTQRFQADKVGEMEDRIDTLTISLVGYYKTPPVLLNK